MVSKEEEIERLKWKLSLYGSYKRESEMLEQRYFEIFAEEKANDMPTNSARNLGFHGDAKHPAVEKMKLEKNSLLNEIGELETEISYLGVDDYLNSLDSIEKIVIDEKYVRKNTIRNIGKLIGKSKSAVHRMLSKLPQSSAK